MAGNGHASLSALLFVWRVELSFVFFAAILTPLLGANAPPISEFSNSALLLSCG